MKKSLRSFGMGLFIAGAILTIVSYFTDDSHTKADSKHVKELEQQLEDAKKELKSLKNKMKETEPTDTTETEQATKDEENQTTETDMKVKSEAIYIYDGMTIYDIGKQAEDLGIVENGRELELFLSKPEYSRSIQKGQFELNSSMSLKEMARILTGKN